MRLHAAGACAILMICLGDVPNHAEKRAALAIGAYVNTQVLPDPRNDAEDVAGRKQMGKSTDFRLSGNGFGLGRTL
ncbi:MAG: hypothetical protein ACLPKB_24575 [Xanthobacteraceae bacterium]